MVQSPSRKSVSKDRRPQPASEPVGLPRLGRQEDPVDVEAHALLAREVQLGQRELEHVVGSPLGGLHLHEHRRRQPLRRHAPDLGPSKPPLRTSAPELAHTAAPERTKDH
eukprot:3934028-Rhodomonas_salina.1